MKKVLFASTALVLTAGVAAAEITLSGEGSVSATSTNGGDFVLGQSTEFEVNGTVTTDGGITFSASQVIAGTENDDVEMTMSFGGATITAGEGQESSAEVASLGGVGHDLTVGNVGMKSAGIADTMDVTIAMSLGDAAVSVGYDADKVAGDNNISLGVTTSVGGVDLALGYETDESMLVGVGYTAGDLGLNLVWADNGTGGAWGVDASYVVGDVTLSGAVTEDSFGAGVAYTMGDATISAGFADNNGSNDMDLGVTYDLGGAELEAVYSDVAGKTTSKIEVSFDF